MLIAALAIGVPLLLIRYGPVVRAAPHRPAPALPPQRVVPAVEVPPVEPVQLVDLAPADARAYNASVPFVAGGVVAARPYRFTGGDADRARAVDCLAAAVIYEAGDDASGERAVAQVVLNRLRHPAYPKTVCGVVFQGSERTTGCQFTFACDGALTRWSPAAGRWARGQTVAAAALNGAVDRRVGLATHYHTDYVVPYWQSSLDKIAAVGAHLFFRWTGWWGTPAAFRDPGPIAEPAIAKLAALSDVHRAASAEPAQPTDLLGAPAATGGLQPVAGDPNSFLVTLPPRLSPSLYPQLAARACADRPQCKFSAWADAGRTPRTLPLAAEQVATMTFAYLRDRPAGLERTLWNCRQSPRLSRTDCMKVQVLSPPAETPAPAPLPLATATPRGPAELTGVHRRGASPAVAPAPADTSRP
ncbi:cell wall hydrolase [Sphingomonas sp.]|uniref:cell wall hydrolase n=1 Tax=Sphingomonas sp. TaxID=28214 RepID=UPI003CC6D840